MAIDRKAQSSAGKSPTRTATKRIAQVFFRAPAELIETVERAAKARAIPVTRQTWLLEAILEKLKREGDKG